MIFLASFDPLVGLISILAILAIAVSYVLKKIKQPFIIGYILMGIMLGQTEFIQDAEAIHRLGELGIILLMFFIGMEISLPDLVKKWKIAIIGTSMQIALSVAMLLILGFFFDWNIKRSIILGFVIALSSSAIVIKLLSDKELIDTKLGQNILSILLTQDILIVPLLILTSFMGGEQISTSSAILMIIGGALIVAILVYIFKKQTIILPFSKGLEEDHELQVFVAILSCFGFALLTSLFGLSGALGAFIGGMVMHAGKSTDWIHDVLHSLRVLFVAFFFIGIGLQIDFTFVWENLREISIVLIMVYLTNHAINSFILKLFGNTWREAILGGSILGQIGELSFLISLSAFNLGILARYGYNFTISLISLTMIISPFWVGLTELFLKKYKLPS
ncbi:cation:proton antiporter [Portibacter lacus]|uniref:Sodium/hydrogen exchanger n=1 Tax=Portibacter lacus TaxID=1099794 RepID=A0AA37SJ09_9BACT|nr:cation:proton antiporter [Portibacter lacus]GLR15593.1 sodium/hydrogen exchanger [Portibacter lacus]